MEVTILKRKISIPQHFYWREILAVLLLLAGIYFFHQQRHEIGYIIPYLHQAHKGWLFAAAAVTFCYVLFQSNMYVHSFRAINQHLSLKLCIELFLKRNFLSVFLPGGGVSALAFIPANVNKAIGNKTIIYQASALYGFAGVLSSFVISVIVLATSFNTKQNSYQIISGLIILSVFIALLFYLIYVVKKEKPLFVWLHNKAPRMAARLKKVTGADVKTSSYILTVLNSLGVEACGIAHLYIAMLAVHVHPSIQAAGLAYVISVLLSVASPFLKGVGAVEVSVAFILNSFGYTNIEALAITVVYRTFEFWLPLLISLFAFLVKAKDLFLRLFPVFFIFLLGLINIFSVLTPPVAARMHILQGFIPQGAIHATNVLIIYIGVTLMVTAAFLIRGLRNAWWIAFMLTLLSLAGHLVKGLDWEEASLALLVLISLLATKQQYTVRINPRLIGRASVTALLVLLGLMIYGYFGFYFLQKKHFNIDFTRYQALGNTLKIFFLQKTGLQPVTGFGKEFLISMYALAIGAWAFLLYAFVKPYADVSLFNKDQQRAEALVEKYGNSPVDYFKLMPDKIFFLSKKYEGFIAYRIERSFAIVLEKPVCADENTILVLEEFTNYCKKAGLKIVYYRVDELMLQDKFWADKKTLLIGQEAVADVQKFDLAGRDKKSLRNALNSLQKKGYTTKLFAAPQSKEFMYALKQISDEWLEIYNRKEMVFSQGSFNESLLKFQDIIATVNSNNKPVAFLNIIPDYKRGECTYDLIRKTQDAPGGCMDALIIELINYAKEKNYAYLNLGLAPMSGLKDADTAVEKVMNYAYEKIRRFQHYRGLRSFKEKYASQWLNKYLVYENDFDLVQIPAALNKAMKP